MRTRVLKCKFIGGNIGNENLIVTAYCVYDADTLQFKHWRYLYDNGEKANRLGYYTYKSVVAFLDTGNKDHLVLVTNGSLS